MPSTRTRSSATPRSWTRTRTTRGGSSSGSGATSWCGTTWTTSSPRRRTPTPSPGTPSTKAPPRCTTSLSWGWATGRCAVTWRTEGWACGPSTGTTRRLTASRGSSRNTPRAPAPASSGITSPTSLGRWTRTATARASAFSTATPPTAWPPPGSRSSTASTSPAGCSIRRLGILPGTSTTTTCVRTGHGFSSATWRTTRSVGRSQAQTR
mmetsp:Transcript_143613/g.250673  ORF Transcript_143613/g.250673 Transcript_143613/m.250673 type:complete len:209 (-) Transcript_143613:88-714(-)